jgi:hypothetical protein
VCGVIGREVEEGDDKWGRAVSEREREEGCGGVFLGWSAAPGWPKGCPAFIFLFLLFSNSVLVYLEFEMQNWFDLSISNSVNI